MLTLNRLLHDRWPSLAAIDLSEWRMWHFWVLGAFVVSALEMLTPGFVLACLAIGCIAAAVVDLVGVTSLLPQIWACAGFTFAALFLVRPFMLRTMRGAKTETGTDLMVGQEAVVTEVGEHDLVPLAKVNNELWRLQPQRGETLNVGQRVRVIGVDGNKLLVEPAAQTAPPAP